MRQKLLRFSPLRWFCTGIFLLGAQRIEALPDCRELWKSGITRLEHWFRQDQESYRDYLKRTQRSSCLKDWTILVYMAADNDLAPYADRDLYEMEAGYKNQQLAGSTLKTDLLVEIDRPGANGSQRLHLFQSPDSYDSQFRATPPALQSPVAEQLPEQDSANASTLRNFIQWGMTRYPAHHTMLVIWGHGDTPLSLARDSMSGSQLSSLDLIPILQQTPQPIDVLTTDTCLLQNLAFTSEVAFSGPRAPRYLVGSTGIADSQGLPYRRLLFELNAGSWIQLRKKHPQASEPELLARMIPPLTRASFDLGRGLQGTPDSQQQASMSSIDLWAFRSILAPRLDAVGIELHQYLAQALAHRVFVSEALRQSHSYFGDLRDLASVLKAFTQLPESNPSLTAASQRALLALDESLLATSLSKEDFSKGLRAFAVDTRNDGRPAARATGLPHWSSWLNDFYFSEVVEPDKSL